jgi:DNA polymerase III delta prime subunit
MRGAIEEFSSNCSFIFTCNFKNRIIDPIHSRCSVIDFKINGSKQAMAAQFFKRVEWILEQEGVKYSKDAVAAVITKHFPDNRRVLNELQRYAVSGIIDAGVLTSVADIQLGALITSLKEKDFGSVRKWVTNNLDNDPVKIYRKLYETLYESLKANSVPQLVLHLAKYQYQAAFVPDHELNMVACLTEIMVDCEFK